MVFTSHPNMVTDSGVHASLNSNNHYQIIYAKFDLKIIYLLPYERRFKFANSGHMKRTIDIFDWESALNYIDANDQVSVFNSTNPNIVTETLPGSIVL